MKFIKDEIISVSIDELVQIKLDAFEDHRGEIWTIHCKDYTDLTFVEDKVTMSRHGVLRGFHGDPHTAKLISCLAGKFQLSVLDLRKDSRTYGNTETYIMSDEEPSIVIVPAGCANAHMCLSDKCVFYYKWSEEYRGPEEQVTVAWNDPNLGITWPLDNPILSERDRNGVNFKGIVL